MKILLDTRPYQLEPERPTKVYLDALRLIGGAVPTGGVAHKERLAAPRRAERGARRFRAVPCASTGRAP